jgi:hypothetical protein
MRADGCFLRGFFALAALDAVAVKNDLAALVRVPERERIVKFVFRHADRVDDMRLLILLLCPGVDEEEVFLFIYDGLELVC